jgi:septum formation protein
MYKIVLASGSPRRREIFEQVGIKFQVHSSNIEEIITKDLPEDIVIELADIKVMDIAKQYKEDTIIIGADTLVALDGQVMGKPKDKQEAYNMIEKLQGNKHQVYTGVAVIIKGKAEKKLTFYESTEVWVNQMEESQILNYIASGEPFDKAGSYGIQGEFAIYIRKIIGDYYNIVGFPIAKLHSVLLKEGIDILRHDKE